MTRLPVPMRFLEMGSLLIGDFVMGDLPMRSPRSGRFVRTRSLAIGAMRRLERSGAVSFRSLLVE